MKTRGHTPSLTMSLQNDQWETAFYILPVTGCEALLGAAWLRTLGDIVWNFDKMTMRFGIGVQSYKAFCRMNAKLVSCKIMTKLLHQEREAPNPCKRGGQTGQSQVQTSWPKGIGPRLSWQAHLTYCVLCWNRLTSRESALYLDSSLSTTLSFQPTAQPPPNYGIKVGNPKGRASTDLLIR